MADSCSPKTVGEDLGEGFVVFEGIGVAFGVGVGDLVEIVVVVGVGVAVGFGVGVGVGVGAATLMEIVTELLFASSEPGLPEFVYLLIRIL